MRKQRLAFVVGLLSACFGPAGLRAQPGVAADRVVRIEVVRRMGPEFSDGSVLGRPNSLLLLSDGSAVVSDAANHTVLVLGPTGELRQTLGGEGAGPGEFRRPCCAALSHDNHLWVRDVQNRRLNSYIFINGRARFDRAVASAPNPALFNDRIAWVGQELVDYSSVSTSDARFRIVRLGVDNRGRSRVVDTLPDLPEESVPVFRTRAGSGSAAFTAPYGATTLRAFARDGAFAIASSGESEISLTTARGRRVVLRSEVGAGPELNAIESERATSQLESIARQGGVSVRALPFGLPSRKPPLESIGFDQDGRLWVVWSRRPEDSRIAEIFDQTGRRLWQAEWPPNIRLLNFAFTGRKGLAIETGSDDEERVVQVQLRSR